MVLMNGCKKLLKSAGGTQEALAEAATSAVKTITAEAEHVKLGATSLGSDRKEEQVHCLCKYSIITTLDNSRTYELSEGCMLITGKSHYPNC